MGLVRLAGRTTEVRLGQYDKCMQDLWSPAKQLSAQAAWWTTVAELRGGLPACRYARIARCAGHSSYITHIDWSADSRLIQSNCGAYELLYFDAATGKQVCCLDVGLDVGVRKLPSLATSRVAVRSQGFASALCHLAPRLHQLLCTPSLSCLWKPFKPQGTAGFQSSWSSAPF